MELSNILLGIYAKQKVFVDYFNFNKIKSDILEPSDIALLKEWLGIDKSKDLKLRLLYKATRDGDTAAAFWSKCNNQGHTLSFIRSKQS